MMPSCLSTCTQALATAGVIATAAAFLPRTEMAVLVADFLTARAHVLAAWATVMTVTGIVL
jgi:hypothetical protein